MGGWHHRLDGREFEQAPGDGEGQGGLVCCSPWGRRESVMSAAGASSMQATGRLSLFLYIKMAQSPAVSLARPGASCRCLHLVDPLHPASSAPHCVLDS